MAVITVLLAEDHAVVREATAEVIDHQPDMRVVAEVGTGREAVARAQELRPDVIVMDIAMPRMNGLQATEEILSNWPEAKILALTAREEEQYIIRLLQGGAVGYLPKTVGLDELLEAIRAVARGESVLPPTVAAVVVRHVAGGKIRDQEPLLTDREREVIALVAQGSTNYEIAQRLHISVRTVEAHLTHIYNKMDVRSRTEAAVYAIQRGWIQPPKSS